MLVVLVVLVTLVLLLVLVVLALLVDVEVDVVVTWLLGRHCEYQSFCFTQVLPEVQQVAPVQPLPPHWALWWDHTVSRHVL